ncbi:MAG: alpha-L-rhamnosidase, partial [Candidatus Symbiothrix sp.]|nr:alpha-L-rhamnosidase [Candidatus Symbiothrix sp.]
SWYNMIRAGSTISLEAWDNKYKSDQDWNHIWGAAAGNLITRKLMGIEPIEPGFGKIRIKPQPATLKHAAIKAPSIRGDIYVSFDNQPGERFTLEVEIPANSASEVWLPKLSAKYRLTVDNITQRGTVDGEFVKVEIGSGKHSLVILTD